MIGFLFGCAAGLAVGCVLGALAAAIFEVKMERDVDRLLTQRQPTILDLPNADPRVTTTEHWPRLAAGVKVCSCIGFIQQQQIAEDSSVRGPHFVDPECPFHGGAA